MAELARDSISTGAWGGFGASYGDMRRLFRLIFQLVAAAIFLFLCIAGLIIFDGLNDAGQKADCAVVIGHIESLPGHPEQPALDRAVKLYNDGVFPIIIVGVSAKPGETNGTAALASYLQSHGVPGSAIIEARRSASTQELTHEVAEIMKSRRFESIMIVTDYYHVTRVKLGLSHEGVADIEKSHVGQLQKEDALKIGREVVALCDYVGHVYLLPAAEKAKAEAQVGMDKASVDTQKAKEKIDKSLDSLAK
jgi:uncharacterized SAM-binding protein YcdF (DUF218 family)